MAQWALYRKRRAATKNALRLLTLSGAVRSSHVEPRYFGREQTIAGSVSEAPSPQQRAPERRSIWARDVMEILQAALNGLAHLRKLTRLPRTA